MESETTTVTTTTLKLNEDERSWLNSVMQNTLWGEDVHTESPRDKAMRKLFFDATNTRKGE